MPTHVGGGYEDDSDWSHGVMEGREASSRTTALTDPTVIARAGFGVIDHVGRALPRRRRESSAQAGLPF